MKNCGQGVVLLALLALSVYNLWMSHSLQAEVRSLREEIRSQRQTTNLMAQAMQALQQAREAVGRTDTAKAKDALETARGAVAGLARSAEPAAHWLQEQVRALTKQLESQRGNAP